MGAVYVFLADGFEELEALTVVDVLRRAGVEVMTVSVKPERKVVSSHGVGVQCDAVFGESTFTGAAALVLPGGMPGATNLFAHKGLQNVLEEAAKSDTVVAAICAAPMVLGRLGLLRGKRATCYPGFEHELEGAQYTGEPVECDGNIVTGRGPGAAMKFAFMLVSILCGPDKTQALKKAMLVE